MTLITMDSENFYTWFFIYLMLNRMKNSIYVSALIGLMLLVIPGFTYYSSATQDTPTEDIDAEDIWGLFRSADDHLNQTVDAVESGNSSVALELLGQVRSDLRDINGNVTNLIFSASQAPP
jgi:hypothetical protein